MKNALIFPLVIFALMAVSVAADGSMVRRLPGQENVAVAQPQPPPSTGESRSSIVSKEMRDQISKLALSVSSIEVTPGLCSQQWFGPGVWTFNPSPSNGGYCEVALIKIRGYCNESPEGASYDLFMNILDQLEGVVIYKPASVQECDSFDAAQRWNETACISVYGEICIGPNAPEGFPIYRMTRHSGEKIHFLKNSTTTPSNIKREIIPD